MTIAIIISLLTWSALCIWLGHAIGSAKPDQDNDLT